MKREREREREQIENDKINEETKQGRKLGEGSGRWREREGCEVLEGNSAYCFC